MLPKELQNKYIKQFTELIKNFKGHPDYPKVLLELLEVHSKKSNDYANEKNPFSNIELCEKVNFPAWKGVIIRLGDKYSRLLNALAGKLFHYEGVKDAFIDLSAYGIIGLIEYEKNTKNKKKKKK
ncbi:MAG: hypothetical protein ACTSYR_02120 [Candidatus Odinarchaeia archaeon]